MLLRRAEVAVLRRKRLDRDDAVGSSRRSRVAERPDEESVEERRNGEEEDEDVEDEEEAPLRF